MYTPGSSSATPFEPIQIEAEDHFEVEALLKHRIRDNSWQHLVRFLGYGPEHNEWICEAELADGAKAILKQNKDIYGLH